MSSLAPYRLLGDEPEVEGADPLGFALRAESLTEMVLASLDSSPYAVGIEGGWGTGKSTLMRRIQQNLSNSSEGQRKEIRTVWYNAWTAERENVLEGLIKSVLNQLDKNVLRRAMRNQQMIGWGRFALGIAASRVGITNAVWDKISADPKTRNQAADLFKNAMNRWLDKNRTGSRVVVVFIDDLDRCSPSNVVQVFEALKLYLDAPRFVFVVGYDQTALSAAVASNRNYAGADGDRSLEYLEKIVQVGYAIGEPNQEQVTAFIEEACRRSGTRELLDASDRLLITERNARNPRRIKRFINRFVLEYTLGTYEPSDAELLIKLLIIQVYFPDFFRTVASTRPDPIGEFLDYVEALQVARNPAAANASQQERFDAFLAAHGAPIPNAPDPGAAAGAVKAAEELLPLEFPALARNAELISLLESTADSRDKLYQRARHLLTQAESRQSAGAGPEATSAKSAPEVASEVRGPIDIVWLDDHPEGNESMVRRLESTGARVDIADTVELAEKFLHASTVPADLLISDVSRNGEEVGFDDARQLRDSGFQGPILFYAGSVTPRRLEQAKALGAEITNDPSELFRIVDQLRARRMIAS